MAHKNHIEWRTIEWRTKNGLKNMPILPILTQKTPKNAKITRNLGPFLKLRSVTV